MLIVCRIQLSTDHVTLGDRQSLLSLRVGGSRRLFTPLRCGCEEEVIHSEEKEMAKIIYGIKDNLPSMLV